MNLSARKWLHQGVWAALAAAALFGMATPAAKWLLQETNPWMLAGLLYLGSGIGLTLYRLGIRAPSVRLSMTEGAWLAAAILAGGVIGPVLLLYGLTQAAASEAALLLNMEGVFTALLAWFWFKENFDRRIAAGMLAIVAGAVVLSWPEQLSIARLWPALAILGACLAWGIDNNLTRKVALHDASWIAAVKGLVAGSVNLLIALLMGSKLPELGHVSMAMLLGFLSYGLSLVLFIIGLRHLGTARTGAYFSVAPLFGAVISVVNGEPVTVALMAAGLLMGFGVWLHISERHEHIHRHEPLAHSHEHGHDEHHQHEHDEGESLKKTHLHWHEHEPIAHSHGHFPDTHHQHKH